MISFQPGEIVLVFVPFTTGTGGKTRPALVVLDTGDADVVLARITTQTGSTPHDIPLTDWQGAGLLAPSVVRIHKLVTSDKARVQRQIGKLTPADHQQVGAALNTLFSGW